MKTTYEKPKSRIVNYRDYKIFCKDTFRQILQEKLSTENINTNCSGFEKFLQICIDRLNIFAPCKKKYSRGNNIPFISKSLKNAHMKWSRLRNIYVKNKADTNRIAYIKQRNYCASLLRKTKKDNYANLTEQDVAGNKQFWRTVKSLLNRFFSNAIKNLKIPEYQGPPLLIIFLIQYSK